MTLLATGSVACGNQGRDDASAEQPNGQPPAVALRSPAGGDDSAAVRAAEAALASWLDASLLEAPHADAPDVAAPHVDGSPARTAVGSPGTIDECGESGATFPSPLLAHYELLTSMLRGDTVVARASVTTVAEQDIDRRAGDRFIVRQRVRTDVLEWDVIPTDAGWAVCNGIRFGYRGADSLTRWTPEGASLNTARVLADSVRGARPAGARHPTS